MNWWERIWTFIGCLALAAIAAILIPILYQILVAAIRAASTPPSCNDWLAILAQALLGISCAAYQAAVQAYGWFMVIGFALILLGLIVLVVRCFISVFRRDEEEDRPNVNVICHDFFGIGQGGVVATINVTPGDTTVNLQSSDATKVAFTQASIVGSATVPLQIGAVPSSGVGDITLKAVASNATGTDSDEKHVTVVELTSINIQHPLAADNNGTFTSQAGENQINLEAIMSPDIAALNNSITWEVDDDPRDGINSGNPADPPRGSNVQFTINPPAAPNGRGAPLSYRIRGKLTINGHEQMKTEYATQDEIDQCRQEYIDMNKNTIPNRGDFVDAVSYIDTGNFPFNEINSGHYNVALFSVAHHLQNIRNRLGHPMIVNSGYRNPIHNANIGGANESQHMYGTAADIDVRDFNGDGATNGHMVPDPNFGNCGDDWSILANEARNEAASFIEPWNMTGGWVHMDWR